MPKDRDRNDEANSRLSQILGMRLNTQRVVTQHKLTAKHLLYPENEVSSDVTVLNGKQLQTFR
jgi:hypothetical protein